MLSLLTGLLLPFGGSQNAVDADGVCGPVLVLAHSVTHFERTPHPVGREHCAFCHWRHAMAGAFADTPADVPRPADVRRAPARPAATDPDLVVTSAFVSRGPPTVS